MSIPLPSALKRSRVEWILGRAGTTGSLTGARGVVQFRASAVAIAYSDRSVLPDPIETPVVAGVMTPVNLIVNDPDDWNWEVTVKVGVPWEPFSIDVPEGGLNLASAAPTPGKGPVRVLKGDQGVQGVSLTSLEQIADDTLRGTIHDPLTGATTTRNYVLPRGPEGPYGGTEVTDPQVASMIAEAGTTTRAAVDTAVAEGASPLVEAGVAPIAARGALPGIFSLIAGTDDETPSVLTPAAGLVADRTNWKVGGQGWKQSRDGAGTLLQAYDGPIQCPPFQAVCLWVYVPEGAAFNDIGVRLYFDEARTTANRWSRAFTAPPAQPIVSGWNFFRIPADWSGTGISDRSTLYRWEVYGITNTTFQSWTIGHLYLETPNRARCMIVADRGYQQFYEGLYQDLKARGIPVTFAVDVTLFGTGTPGGASEAMTEELMHQVAQENGNSISFHGWDGAPTAQMTPAQLRTDTAKAVKWLQRHGYTGRMWRAAYVQNAATVEAHAEVKDLLVGASTPRSVSALTPWPPRDRHDIPRYAMDNNRSLAEITGWFTKMRQSHMTGNIFVHSEHEVNQYDYSAARRAHFLAEIDAAMEDGWLEFHTFESLFHQSGGTFQSLGGAHVAEFTDAAGARITQSVL